MFYYIQSSEIQENSVDILCKSMEKSEVIQKSYMYSPPYTIFNIFTSENIKSYIFTPPECTYNFFGLPLTFPLTYCSGLQNFKRL